MELSDINNFVSELNKATQAHLNWVSVALNNRNIKAMPRHDLERMDSVLSVDSHKTCEFGRWFKANSELFNHLDEYRTYQFKRDHFRMHEAARIYYSNPEKNMAYFSQLVSGQESIVDHLSYFKSSSKILFKEFFMS